MSAVSCRRRRAAQNQAFFGHFWKGCKVFEFLETLNNNKNGVNTQSKIFDNFGAPIERNALNRINIRQMFEFSHVLFILAKKRMMNDHAPGGGEWFAFFRQALRYTGGGYRTQAWMYKH